MKKVNQRLKRLSVCIVFCAMCLTTKAQVADSLHKQLARPLHDTIRTATLLALADEYVKVNTDSFYYFSRKAFFLSRRTNQRTNLSKSAANLGYFFRYDGSYDSAVHYYEIALKHLSDQHKDLPTTLYALGNVYKAMDEFAKANDHYLLSLKTSDNQKNVLGNAIANLGLGGLHLAQKEVNNAISFYREALKSFEEIGDKRGAYIATNNLGTALFEIEDYSKAKPYFLSAQTEAKRLKDFRGLSDIYSNLGLICEKEQDYDSALLFHKKSIDMRKKLNIKDGIVKSYHNLASVNINLRNFLFAENYLDSAYTIIEEISSSVEFKYYWNYKFQLDTAKKDYQSATHSLFQYMIYKQRVEDNDLKTQIADLQTKYETEKKDQAIQNLYQQSQIQALQINQQKYIFIIVGSLGLMILILGYFYFQQKKQRQQRATDQMEQRLLRTQMNPHFIFNALGAIQNFMLKNDNQNAAKYLSKFGKLMRQILDHSRQEFIPLEEEVDTLTNYFEIQKLRFAQVFEYHIEVDTNLDLAETMIPPMLAQPFLENAIEHGMSNRTENGMIEVIFTNHNGLIKLEIKDNGTGIKAEKTSEHKSLATMITKERLSLLSRTLHQKLNFFIENIKNTEGKIEGTKVELYMPTKR